MSSYLTFYLKPKDKFNCKPLSFISYSRGSDVYQAFNEYLHPVFIGNGEEPNYTELTTEKCKYVLDKAKEDLEQTKQRFNDRVEAFKQLTNVDAKTVNDYVQDYTETKEYIKELEECVTEIQCIYDWVSEIEYSSFEKVLINID